LFRPRNPLKQIRDEPHPLPRTTTSPSALAFAPVKYMCESCGFIYDPEIGDPDGGIPPGTQFEDIPETWFCPVCGARKRDFTPYDD
jgi:rubredoxin